MAPRSGRNNHISLLTELDLVVLLRSINIPSLAGPGMVALELFVQIRLSHLRRRRRVRAEL